MDKTHIVNSTLWYLLLLAHHTVGPRLLCITRVDLVNVVPTTRLVMIYIDFFANEHQEI